MGPSVRWDDNWGGQRDMCEIDTFIETALGSAGCRVQDPSTHSPQLKGAYLLVLSLENPVAVALRQGALSGSFMPGTYVYAGNAYGPGGLKARLSRHLDKSKKLHWHADRVTAHAASIEALALPGAQECDLIARLLETGAFSVPLPGFGSSDCRSCPSHFLKWETD